MPAAEVIPISRGRLIRDGPHWTTSRPGSPYAALGRPSLMPSLADGLQLAAFQSGSSSLQAASGERAAASKFAGRPVRARAGDLALSLAPCQRAARRGRRPVGPVTIYGSQHPNLKIKLELKLRPGRPARRPAARPQRAYELARPGCNLPCLLMRKSPDGRASMDEVTVRGPLAPTSSDRG
jgi:hypothetical protein